MHTTTSSLISTKRCLSCQPNCPTKIGRGSTCDDALNMRCICKRRTRIVDATRTSAPRCARRRSSVWKALCGQPTSGCPKSTVLQRSLVSRQVFTRLSHIFSHQQHLQTDELAKVRDGYMWMVVVALIDVHKRASDHTRVLNVARLIVDPKFGISKVGYVIN